jgi:hypothetical protein
VRGDLLLVRSRRGRRSVTVDLARRCRRPLLALCLLALIHQAHARPLVAQTIGEAFDQNTNELLYSETHCVSQDALTREVLYRNTEEQLIAYKVLRYDSGPMTPSFEQRNLYSNEIVAIEWQRGTILVTSGEDIADGKTRSVSLLPRAESPIVIDAGFDAFVIGNWDSLVGGREKRFQFPVAALEAMVELRIESAPCSYDTQTDQCFTLEVDNWLIRMVADAIELGYNSQLRRLTRFRGVSNISDVSGASLVVDIHYRYQYLAALQCTKNRADEVSITGGKNLWQSP